MVCAIAAIAALSAGARAGESVVDGFVSSVTGDVPCPPLASYGYGGRGTYQLAPGYTYSSWSTDSTEVTTNVFSVTGFSERVDLGAEPISLAPILERMSWWSLGLGSADLTNGGTTGTGSVYTVSGTAMGTNGLGMSMAMSRSIRDDETFGTESLAFALLADYARGGRVALTYAESELFIGDPDADWRLIWPSDEWGVDWTHIARFGEMWFVFGAGWGRVTDRTGADAPQGDRLEERLTFYPSSRLGLVLWLQQRRGEIDDFNCYGGGFTLDMEQVRLALDLRREDDAGDGAESKETLTVSLELRFCQAGDA
jgi:hypothetical protein